MACTALTLIYAYLYLQRKREYREIAQQLLKLHDNWIIRTPLIFLYGSSFRYWENSWSKTEMGLAKEKIRQYKKVREIIQHGDQYRILPTWKGNLVAVEYVNKDKNLVVLFVFLHSQQFGEKLPPVKLKGLISDSLYQFQDGNKKVILRGKALKEIGVKVDLKGDFDSKLIILEKENKRND